MNKKRICWRCKKQFVCKMFHGTQVAMDGMDLTPNDFSTAMSYTNDKIKSSPETNSTTDDIFITIANSCPWFEEENK